MRPARYRRNHLQGVFEVAHRQAGRVPHAVYRDGTTHVVFAPHSPWRAEVTPAGRGTPTTSDPRTPAERYRAMTWAQRLKRVFGIEIETCEVCGGKVRVIASIEDPAVVGVVPNLAIWFSLQTLFGQVLLKVMEHRVAPAPYRTDPAEKVGGFRYPGELPRSRV